MQNLRPGLRPTESESALNPTLRQFMCMLQFESLLESFEESYHVPQNLILICGFSDSLLKMLIYSYFKVQWSDRVQMLNVLNWKMVHKLWVLVQVAHKLYTLKFLIVCLFRWRASLSNATVAAKVPVRRAIFSPQKGFEFAQTLGTSAWLRSQNSWHIKHKEAILDWNFLGYLLPPVTLITEKSL